MPTLRQDRGARWMARVVANGRTIATKLFGQGPERGKEWRKAHAWELREKDKLLAGQTRNSAPALTPLAWIVAHLENVKQQQSEKTFMEKKCVLQRFLKAVDGKGFPEITPGFSLAYLQEQATRRSGHAANVDRKNLSAAWEFGRRFLDGFPRELPNPFAMVHKFPEVPKPRYIPPLGDFHKVLSAAQGQDQVMLRTLYELAARKDEIFRLKWTDVDFTGEGKVRLWTRKTRGGAWRPDWLPMTPQLRKALLWWWENRPDKAADHTFVCVDIGDAEEHEWRGKPFVSRQHLLKRLCRKAGVAKFDFHAIRHLRAIELYKAGNRLSTVQKWLRHQSAGTTEVYLRSLGLDLDELLEAANLIGRGPAKVLAFAKSEAPGAGTSGASCNQGM